MAIEQLKSLLGVVRQDPASAPDGKHEPVSEGKTSVVSDLYNLDFNDKKALLGVSAMWRCRLLAKAMQPLSGSGVSYRLHLSRCVINPVTNIHNPGHPECRCWRTHGRQRPFVGAGRLNPPRSSEQQWSWRDVREQIHRNAMERPPSPSTNASKPRMQIQKPRRQWKQPMEP
jgi:hypothetical protein